LPIGVRAALTITISSLILTTPHQQAYTNKLAKLQTNQRQHHSRKAPT
jgi:hypothetical protein